ncbi:hypothetical protein VCR4J2_250461 [Vibrio coralliirubri]|nr:hypothetical protein VCR4J2_250461 [Vibrio coralliirubri]
MFRFDIWKRYFAKKYQQPEKEQGDEQEQKRDLIGGFVDVKACCHKNDSGKHQRAKHSADRVRCRCHTLTYNALIGCR